MNVPCNCRYDQMSENLHQQMQPMVKHEEKQAECEQQVRVLEFECEGLRWELVKGPSVSAET